MRVRGGRKGGGRNRRGEAEDEGWENRSGGEPGARGKMKECNVGETGGEGAEKSEEKGRRKMNRRYGTCAVGGGEWGGAGKPTGREGTRNGVEWRGGMGLEDGGRFTR